MALLSRALLFLLSPTALGWLPGPEVTDLVYGEKECDQVCTGTRAWCTLEPNQAWSNGGKCGDCVKIRAAHSPKKVELPRSLGSEGICVKIVGRPQADTVITSASKGVCKACGFPAARLLQITVSSGRAIIEVEQYAQVSIIVKNEFPTTMAAITTYDVAGISLGEVWVFDEHTSPISKCNDHIIDFPTTLGKRRSFKCLLNQVTTGALIESTHRLPITRADQEARGTGDPGFKVAGLTDKDKEQLRKRREREMGQ